MANKEISELTVGGTPDGTEMLHGVQSGNSRKFSLANLLAWWLTDDDTMATAVATKPASGESVKAYFDSRNTPWVAYTPTFTGFGTVSTSSFWSRRVGDTLQIRGKFVVGTPTGTEARITLGFGGTNANVTSSSSKLSSGTNLVGAWATDNAALGAASPTTLIEPSVGYLTFGFQTATAAGQTKQNANAISLTGNTLEIQVEVPISGW